MSNGLTCVSGTKEMTKFMVAVCMNTTSCAAPAVNDSSVPGFLTTCMMNWLPRSNLVSALSCYILANNYALVTADAAQFGKACAAMFTRPRPQHRGSLPGISSPPIATCHKLFRIVAGIQSRRHLPCHSCQDTINNQFTFTALPTEARAVPLPPATLQGTVSMFVIPARCAHTTRDIAYHSPASPSERRIVAQIYSRVEQVS